MVFTSEIKGAKMTSPAVKRYAEGGRLEEKWGIWDGTGVTTGEIDLECDNVLFCEVTIESATPVPVRVQLDTASAGKVTISEFTAGHAGRFKALCSYN